MLFTTERGYVPLLQEWTNALVFMCFAFATYYCNYIQGVYKLSLRVYSLIKTLWKDVVILNVRHLRDKLSKFCSEHNIYSTWQPFVIRAVSKLYSGFVHVLCSMSVSTVAVESSVLFLKSWMADPGVWYRHFFNIPIRKNHGVCYPVVWSASRWSQHSHFVGFGNAD